MKQTLIVIAMLLSLPLTLSAQHKSGTYYGTYTKCFTSQEEPKCCCWIQPDGTVFINPESAELLAHVYGYRYPETYTMPETVTDSVGNVYQVSGTARYGFEGSALTNIKKITFPECYKVIDAPKTSYGGLTSVVEVDAPGLEKMGWNFLNSASKLKKVNMPKVKEMSGMSFYGCSSLESIDLPELEYYYDQPSNGMAFLGCKSLVHVNLPKLKYMGKEMFAYCNSLKVLNLPSVEEVNPIAFEGTYYCDTIYIGKAVNIEFSAMPSSYVRTLKKISLPNVETISTPWAFSYLQNLTDIDMPKLKKAGESLFQSCSSLKHVELPSLEEGKKLFQYCTNLVYLSLKNYKEDINLDDNNLIGNCNKLDTLLIPSCPHVMLQSGIGGNVRMLDISSITSDNIYSVPNYNGEFRGVGNIKHIICHDASVLDKINRGYTQTVFTSDNDYNAEGNTYNYPGFDSVEIVNQTEVMAENTFAHTPNIKHIVIHNNTVLNGLKTMADLGQLETIDVAKDETEDYSSVNGVLFNKAGNKLLYYPHANETTAEPDETENRPWLFPNHNITGIGPYALYKYVGKDPRSNEGFHHEIHISKGESCEIGEHALDGSSVDHVTFDLDAPLTTVSESAFANMTEPAFRYLKMPKALTTIEQNAFSGDTELQALELYDTQLKTVGDNAFQGQTTITSIALPNTVETIGKNAFSGNTAMEYVTLPTSLTDIGEGALSGCTNLKVINIPSTTIAGTDLDKAFADTDTKPSLHLTDALKDNFNDWTIDEPTRQVTVAPSRYLSFSRSYPVSIDVTKAPYTHFYRAVGISERKTSGDYEGHYLVKLKRLTNKELQLVPANSTILMWNMNNKNESFAYTIHDNEEAKTMEESVVKATPGAIRLDQTETIDGDTYTNFLLNSSATNTGVYNLVALHPWYDIATRKGEKSYLQLKGDLTLTAAKGIKFIVEDDTTTGINDISEDKDDDSMWYSVSGTATKHPTHGVYIHNGKKVVVK